MDPDHQGQLVGYEAFDQAMISLCSRLQSREILGSKVDGNRASSDFLEGSPSHPGLPYSFHGIPLSSPTHAEAPLPRSIVGQPATSAVVARAGVEQSGPCSRVPSKLHPERLASQF